MLEEKLKRVEEMIRNGLELEEAFQLFDWKDFEELVSEIFEKHNYKVTSNFWFKVEKRYQIDFLAEKGDVILAVDCKQWGKHRYKSSSLKREASKHMVRAEKLKVKFSNKKIIPIIITLVDEGIYEFGDVIIVPISKLNSFLCQL